MPTGLRESSEPLAPRNRFLRLRAAFTCTGWQVRASRNAYGDALWYGIFDAAYTRPGDYLVQADSVWFIAAQQRLLPVLCVQTNRIVSFWRPAAPSNTGVNTYGGVTTETNEALLANWPASVLGAAGRGRPNTDLPSDSSSPLLDRSTAGDTGRDPASVGPDDRRSRAECGRCRGRTDRSWLAHDDEAGNDLMADQSDVEIALVNVVSAALYPPEPTKQAFPGRTAGSIAAGRTRRHWMPTWQPARSTSQFSRRRRQPDHDPIRRALDGRAAAHRR